MTMLPGLNERLETAPAAMSRMRRDTSRLQAYTDMLRTAMRHSFDVSQGADRVRAGSSREEVRVIRDHMRFVHHGYLKCRERTRRSEPTDFKGSTTSVQQSQCRTGDFSEMTLPVMTIRFRQSARK